MLTLTMKRKTFFSLLSVLEIVRLVLLFLCLGAFFNENLRTGALFASLFVPEFLFVLVALAFWYDFERFAVMSLFTSILKGACLWGEFLLFMYLVSYTGVLPPSYAALKALFLFVLGLELLTFSFSLSITLGTSFFKNFKFDADSTGQSPSEISTPQENLNLAVTQMELTDTGELETVENEPAKDKV